MGSHHKEWTGSVEGFEFSVDGLKNFREEDCFSGIRNEMGQFLLELIKSRQAGSAEQQVHCLFLALKHLDNLDMEIRMHTASGTLAGHGYILKRIRSLSGMISVYIRKINGEKKGAASGFLQRE